MSRSTPILLKYIPHGLDEKIFKPLDKNDPEFLKFKKDILKDKEYDFVVFFNSRNIRRKQIPDTLLAYRLFLDTLPKEKAEKCMMLMHVDPVSEHGTDIPVTIDYLLADYKENILLSPGKISPEQMNMMYNIADIQILMTSNEGWGLSLTEALLAGTPILANVQGGMQDQMRFEDENGNWLDFNKDFPSNHRGTYTKHGEWAFPIYPSNISIQGSPLTPYISDDRCKPEDACEQLKYAYLLGKEELERRGLKGREWAIGNEAQFTAKQMGENVIKSLDALFETWKPRETFNFSNVTTEIQPKTIKHKLIY